MSIGKELIEKPISNIELITLKDFEYACERSKGSVKKERQTKTG